MYIEQLRQRQQLGVLSMQGLPARHPGTCKAWQGLRGSSRASPPGRQDLRRTRASFQVIFPSQPLTFHCQQCVKFGAICRLCLTMTSHACTAGRPQPMMGQTPLGGGEFVQPPQGNKIDQSQMPRRSHGSLQEPPEVGLATPVVSSCFGLL